MTIRAISILSLLFCLSCERNVQGRLASQRVNFETEPVPKARFDALFRSSCGDGGISTSGEQAFLRKPYLQKMTSSGVQILWTSDQVGPTSVVVRKPGGALVAEVDAASAPQENRPEFDQYVATLDSLASETIYCYEIVGEDGVWLASTGFRTAPDADSNTPIRVAAVGDLGEKSPDQFAVRAQLENVQYDLVLLPGDIAYDKGTLRDHERNFFAVYEHMMRSIPFFVISGNHDYAADGAVFREVFSLPENGGPSGVERWYSMDWGSVHIVALDTEKLDGALGRAQVEWLDRDLAAHQDSTTIVFMHRPPYSSGHYGSDKSTQAAFSPLFEKYGVDLVFAGHEHNYERTTPVAGVTYVVTGGGGRGTRNVGTSDFTAYSEAVAHFTHLTIDAETISLNAIDATGQDFDAEVLDR